MEDTMKVLVGVQSAMEAAAKAQVVNLNLNPFPEKIEHFTVEDFVNALFQLHYRKYLIGINQIQISVNEHTLMKKNVILSISCLSKEMIR